MSLRGTKRALGVRSEDAGASKRRRTEPEDALWQLRPVSDLKISSIYNRSASEAPAELFRKDLISAMKLPDNEPLTPSEYWVITDTWKQDWERGVQVPVNPDSLPSPKVKIIENPLPPNFEDFKLPAKFIHLTRDAFYQPDKQQLSTSPARAEAACSYDLDATDTAWLKLLNAERARAGAPPVTEDQLEKVIEELEIRSWDKIQAIMKSEEGLGIEYDENVICDVCRSPDSEDGNEMVFCDSCNICVHQACYGITVIPDGQWLCRPCGDGVRPTCVLCPNLGGAMKCTPSGHKWAHVSCVLWIPEVSIGCAEKMEPITKISSIPASRWSLVCVLCRERKGACIQCSVKTCKTAYHVTCAFKHGLEMRAIIEDENADDGVKLRSYCQKHSVTSKKDKCPGSGSEEEETKKKRRKDMTSEEKSQARTARLQEIEREFDNHVSVKDISTHLLDVDQDAINYIYNYWKLKRRAGHNRPLLPPKSDDSELLTHRQEQADLDKLKMFVQLRQDLERVRNLCYMVSRREKLSRSFFRMREQTFHKQVAVLTMETTLSEQDMLAIVEANHGPSIYDRLYSHANAPDHKNDFDNLLKLIAPQDSSDERRRDKNGLVKDSKHSNNPYKKHYVNGSRRSGSIYSGISSEESTLEMNRSSRYRGRAIDSTTDDDDKKSGLLTKKKIPLKSKIDRSKKTENKKKKLPASKAHIESSSEDDGIKSKIKKERTRSKTLQQMEKEMTACKTGQSGTDSDELMPIRSTRNSKFTVDIYSDSSDDKKIDIKCQESKSGKPKPEKVKTDKLKLESSPSGNDSQQSLPRTKAAMKEFVPSQSDKKNDTEKPEPRKRGRKPSNKEKLTSIKSNDSDDDAKNKENIKFSKQKENPSDFIVPQRQAAKKASENMRSTTIMRKEDSIGDKLNADDLKSRPKLKTKDKDTRDNELKDKEVKDKDKEPKEKDKESKEKEKDLKEKDKQIKDKPKEDKDKEINNKEAKGKVTSMGGLKKPTAKEVEKETIAIVPQRQAAKKAAAHIKSGLANKVPVTDTNEYDKKKDDEKSDQRPSPKKDTSPKKDSNNKVLITPKKESSSSSSNSSSSDSSSSSSTEDEEKPEIKPTSKAREIKPATRQPSLFSPPSGSRPTVDLPFLDKVSRPLSSTSASSDSDSSNGSRFSDSGGPIPKRPRRKRKIHTSSTDASPHKAPDKKLKTSERGSICGISSPSFEGEESNRPTNTRAATRARTRSTTSIGNMLDKSDTRHQKPSNKDSTHISASNKTVKDSSQPSKLPAPERQAYETLDKEFTQVNSEECIKNNAKLSNDKQKKLGLSLDDKCSFQNNLDISSDISPSKTLESKTTTTSNKFLITKEKLSVKDTSPRSDADPTIDGDNESSTRDIYRISASSDNQFSPKKFGDIERSLFENSGKKCITEVADDFSNHHNSWMPKSPSPHNNLPAIEKPDVHEKYMTDDKSFDSDSADKSSIKMIARIQANLNENTMIKSPKTPMDARTSLDLIDIDSSITKSIRKSSTFDTESKFTAQDASHVQGVEISKSAKIPLSVNQYTNRSIFSPQSKENELFEFDMLSVDDTFNNDDMMKPLTELLFKEDSKEQGVQETRNLVDRLRMQLISKKVSSDNSLKDDIVCDEQMKVLKSDENNSAANTVCIDIEDTSSNFNKPLVYCEKKTPQTENLTPNVNHIPLHENNLPPIVDIENKSIQSISVDEKWQKLPMNESDSHNEMVNDEKYDSGCALYNDEAKDSLQSVQTELQSEKAETISSKQSDDSQSISVVDHSIPSNDHDMTQDNQTCDNNNSFHHSDCGNVPSPYINHGGKWSESKITRRRSSASSTNSEESIGSQQVDLKSNTNTSFDSHKGNIVSEMEAYTPISAYQVDPAVPLTQYTYPPDTPPFLSTIASLPLYTPPVSVSSQLPLQSSISSLYVPYSKKPPTPPKTTYPTLSAAFTSSSQNIELTTTMIAPPTPKPVNSPQDDLQMPESDKYAMHLSSSPTITADSYKECSTKTVNKSSNSIESLNVAQSVDSKTSIKTVKPSSKFPGKSPGKSPISPKSNNNKRLSNKSNRSQRGRGRSKSRSQGLHGFPPVDYLGNSIQSKLVGTVYDFDEEIANDGVDLKSLRERRKSLDVREERKLELSFKDTSQSPHVVSPLQNKRTPAEIKEISTSIASEMRDLDSSNNKNSSERSSGFSHVQPLLPGPVDMRTYQPFENTVPVVNDSFHSLVAFESGTADQQLPDIDEEVEKQLHNELIACKAGPSSPSTIQPRTEVNEQPKDTPQLPKVSLSDSRNQLKVKIKGPFRDANYSTGSVQPVVQLPPAPVHEATTNISVSSGSTNMMSGSTNLRRMRKKELLRQYWTQDMNMDPTSSSTTGSVPPPVTPAPLARAVITIPKAVASMTSIPTREDYKISDSPTEKKKRKTTSGLSRELRHLEVTMNNIDHVEDIKLPSYVVNSNQSHKRRGRLPTKPNKNKESGTSTPKLKIKIGSNIVQQVNEEPPGVQFRPPKKRLASMALPSLEDIRRESMKYRRMVMADFQEHKKSKKHKPGKSEKRKKKKDKKLEKEKLQVINSESESATKLIIKIKRTKESDDLAEGASRDPVTGPVAAASVAPEPQVDPFEYDPSAPDPLALDPPSYSESTSVMRKIRTAKVTPIRLKFARSSQGSGYVMKEASEENVISSEDASSTEVSVPASSQSLSLSTSKHCEVR